MHITPSSCCQETLYDLFVWISHFLCAETFPAREQTVCKWNLSSERVRRGLTSLPLFMCFSLSWNLFPLASQTFQTFSLEVLACLQHWIKASDLRFVSLSVHHLIMFGSRFLSRFSFCCSRPARIRIYTVSLTHLKQLSGTRCFTSIN